MGACQPTQLMTITNFVIVISLCAQLNLLICRSECLRGQVASVRRRSRHAVSDSASRMSSASSGPGTEMG